MIRVALTVAVVLALLVPAVTAGASSARKRVCTRSATLRDTPRGFVIARLTHGQRVTVVRRSAAPGWSNVRTSAGVPGWILTRSLCA